jgi:iron(III) transport system substrate-binding protein
MRRACCLGMLMAAAALCAAGCSPGSGKSIVVVYSPHGSEVLQDYEIRFEQANPGHDLQWLDMGAQEVYARLRAESGRPACDLWWGAPSTLFSQAAREGLLAPYQPAWADAVAPGFKDAGAAWHATYLSPLAILYNDRHYKPEDVPQGWDDLLKPEWHGKIALRKPLASGTMRTFISAMIARAENEDAGIAWLKQLHAATADYLENPQLLYDHIKRHPERISVWLLPDILMQRDRNGFPFGYHIPPQTPVLTEGIAIVKGAPHEAAAKQLYDFVTSEDSLIHQAEAYSKMPARADVPKDRLPVWMREIALDPMPIDWALFAEKEAAWCARWEKEVYAAK